VIAVDTAMETGEGNDYTACVVLGRAGHRIDVLRVERHKIPFVEQLMLVCVRIPLKLTVDSDRN
jgi:hypothetical protein